MASIISEVLIVLLFVVPSATAWSTRSTHHQMQQQQLQSRRSQQHSTSSRLLLASSSPSPPAAEYDDFISREDWQALSQEDRNVINEKRRLTNPDADSNAPTAVAAATTTDVTIETTTTTAAAAADGRYQGTVKWFNMVKGFGFVIRDDNKEDVFVHQTSIQSEGFRGLTLGAAVEFEIETIGDRTAAVNVTKPGGKKFKETSTTTTTDTPPPSSSGPSLEAEIEVKDDAVANLISQSIF